MAMDVNQTCCDHIAIYSNVESLHCMPEINIMLYINYTSVKRNNI